MPRMTDTKTALAIVMAACGLGGCTTSADFSYTEYQFGPGFQSEHVYENLIYGDTSQGVGSEACRVTVRREVDAFGEVFAREVTVCDEF